MASKSTFKPPKPRIYIGNGNDRDPAVFDAWKDEVMDYLLLAKIPEENHIAVIQYLVSDTARDYYVTTRKGITEANPLTAEELLKGRKEHVVPSTHVNQYWKQWDKIS